MDLSKYISPRWVPRDYQRKGIDWMKKQEHSKFHGGLLADEMGLGKTIQTLFTIAENTCNGSNGKATLVVCTKSCLKQWESEIRNFFNFKAIKKDNTPFNVLTYYGIHRKEELNKAILHHNDIVLTTYGVLSHEFPKDDDGTWISKIKRGPLFWIRWYRIVLDEGDEIRNAKSLKFKSTTCLSSTKRWILSGTPIQNSMMDFANSLQFLKAINRSQITTWKRKGKRDFCQFLNEQKQNIVLQRTKKQVRINVPDKQSRIVFLDFTKEEMQIYYAFMIECRLEFNKFVRQGTVLENQFRILQLLNKLRRCCCHPFLCLAKRQQSHSKIPPSTKILQLLKDILPIRLSEKIIIFSEWTSMLDIIQYYLVNELHLNIVRLDGSMSQHQRQQEIHKFNTSNKHKIFLISLKAGGKGLNLTKASRIFIYEPYWNEPTEMQAIARAHRLGQQKNVYTIKYIIKDSVEMNIVQLKQKKLQHEKGVMANNINIIKNLELHDLKLLFKLPDTLPPQLQ